MSNFDYNRFGQQQTGFDNSIDHSLYGHWSNPEYSQEKQEAEQSMREQDEQNPFHVRQTIDFTDDLPF